MQPIPSQLLALPLDIKGILFGYLDGRTLTRLRQACKPLKECIDKADAVWKQLIVHDYTDYPLPDQAIWRKLYRDHFLLLKPNKRPKKYACNFSEYDRHTLANFFKEDVREEFKFTSAKFIDRFATTDSLFLFEGFNYLVEEDSIEKLNVETNQSLFTFRFTKPIFWFTVANHRLIVGYKDYVSDLWYCTIWNNKTYTELNTFNITEGGLRLRCTPSNPIVFSHVLYVTVECELAHSHIISTQLYDLATGLFITKISSSIVHHRHIKHKVIDGYIFEGLKGYGWDVIDLRSQQPTLQDQKSLKKKINFIWTQLTK